MTDPVSLQAQIATLKAQRNQALDAVVELQGALAVMTERMAIAESGMAVYEAAQNAAAGGGT